MNDKIKINTLSVYSQVEEALKFSNINELDYKKSASPLLADMRIKAINILSNKAAVELEPGWRLVCDDRGKKFMTGESAMYFINEEKELVMRMRASNKDPQYDHPAYPKDEIPINHHMHFSFAFQRFNTYGKKTTVKEFEQMSAKDWKTFKTFSYSMHDTQSFKVPFKTFEKEIEGFEDIKNEKLKLLLKDSLNSIDNFRVLEAFVLNEKLSDKEQKLVQEHLNPGLSILPNIQEKRDFHLAQELKLILNALQVPHTDEQFMMTCNSGLMPYLRVENFANSVLLRHKWEDFGAAIDYLFENGAKFTEKKSLSFNDGDNNFFLFEHNSETCMSLKSQEGGYILKKSGDIVEGYARGSSTLYSKEQILNDFSVDKLSLIIKNDDVIYWDSLLDPEQYTIFGAVSALAHKNNRRASQEYNAHEEILKKYKENRSIIKEQKLLDNSIKKPRKSKKDDIAFKV